MARKKSTGDMIRLATDGLVGTTTDALLYLTYITFTMAGKHTSYEIDRAFQEAEQLLGEINYQTLKRALAHLITEGLIDRSPKKSAMEIAITKKGKERITATIPVYQKDRPWDGYLYLVSYDVPKIANTKRDLLRDYIRKTGGALLQESLWIHPYNPKILLEEFTTNHQIPGTVLISKLGKDGAIGETSIHKLVTKIYTLDALAEEYNEFIEKYQHKKKIPYWKVSLDYFRILKHDPQLPFPLLPKNFPADSAHELFIFYRKLHNLTARADE